MTVKKSPQRNESTLSRLREALATFAQLQSALQTEDYVTAGRLVEVIDNLSDLLEKAKDEYIRIRPDRSSIEAKRAEQRTSYADILEETLRNRSVPVTGKWPQYTVGVIFRVEVNLRDDTVKVNDDIKNLVSPGRLADDLIESLAEIERSIPIELFEDALRSAYTEKASTANGGYVDIHALYESVAGVLKRKVRSYTATRFGIDIYRLSRMRRDGIDLSPSQSAAGGLYIPSDSGGNFASALKWTA